MSGAPVEPSQRLEESDEGLLLFKREIQAEAMTVHRASTEGRA